MGCAKVRHVLILLSRFYRFIIDFIVFSFLHLPFGFSLIFRMVCFDEPFNGEIITFEDRYKHLLNKIQTSHPFIVSIRTYSSLWAFYICLECCTTSVMYKYKTFRACCKWINFRSRGGGNTSKNFFILRTRAYCCIAKAEGTILILKFASFDRFPY